MLISLAQHQELSGSNSARLRARSVCPAVRAIMRKVQKGPTFWCVDERGKRKLWREKQVRLDEAAVAAVESSQPASSGMRRPSWDAASDAQTSQAGDSSCPSVVDDSDHEDGSPHEPSKGSPGAAVAAASGASVVDHHISAGGVRCACQNVRPRDYTDLRPKRGSATLEANEKWQEKLRSVQGSAGANIGWSVGNYGKLGSGKTSASCQEFEESSLAGTNVMRVRG